MRFAWRLGYVRLLAYALVLLQVVQPATDRSTLSAYMQSYWLVSYDHGFVRRGLTGTTIGLFGHSSTSLIAAAAWTAAAVTVVAVIVLMELLFRARTARSAALGLLLACSPFVIEYAVFERRPDLIGVPLLIVLGIVLLYARRFLLALGLAIGVLFALAVFVHEAVALYALPWALVMLLIVAPNRRGGGLDPKRLVRLSLVVIVPTVVALAVVGIWGRPPERTVESLRQDASFLHVGTRRNGTPLPTAFDFLRDDLHAAVDRVNTIPKSIKVGDVLLAGVLTLIQGAWLLLWARAPLAQQLKKAGAPTATLCSVAVVLGTAALFATGIDWLRWVALVGAAFLITYAFAELAEAPPPDAAATVQVPTFLPIVAVYLAAIGPIGESATISRALTLLRLG